MPTELDKAKQRGEPYEAQVASEGDVRKVFGAAWACIDESFDWNEPEIRETIKRQLESAELVAAYRSVIPCVEALVGTELDYRTPGERGLGRASTSHPRLAGAFREKLSDPTVREVFGPLIEATVRDAYVGTAAITAGYVRPAVLPAHQVFEVWIHRAFYGTQNTSELGIEMIACCNSKTEIRAFEEANTRGLIGGIRRKKREQTFTASASFWIAAGAALFRAASDHPD